jgi:peptidyl-prolyl cis-trans isomerase A (cyclophilin A)
MLKKIIAAFDRLDWRFKAFVVVFIFLPIYFSSAPGQRKIATTPIAQPGNQPKNIVSSGVPIIGSEQGAGSPQREQKAASDGVSAAAPPPQPTRTEREHKRREAPDQPGEPVPGSQSAAAVDEAPVNFNVRFATTKGPFLVQVHKAWAPIGVQRFYELVKAKYYDGNRFFRIVPTFIVQFGMAGDPAMTRKWDKNIPDDPVLQTNRAGSVTFATAGPNTRTTQLFINLRSNISLDSQGFAPFGIVVQGMSVVERLNQEYGERPDQDEIRQRGNLYLAAFFPRLDYIENAFVVPSSNETFSSSSEQIQPEDGSSPAPFKR